MPIGIERVCPSIGALVDISLLGAKNLQNNSFLRRKMSDSDSDFEEGVPFEGMDEEFDILENEDELFDFVEDNDDEVRVIFRFCCVLRVMLVFEFNRATLRRRSRPPGSERPLQRARKRRQQSEQRRKLELLQEERKLPIPLLARVCFYSSCRIGVL